MKTLIHDHVYKILILVVGVLFVYGIALAQTSPYFLTATINTYALDTGNPIAASYTGQVAVDLENPVSFDNTDDPSNRLVVGTGRVNASEASPRVTITTVASANNYYEFGDGSYIEVVGNERCDQTNSPTAVSVPVGFVFNGLASGQTCEVEIDVYLSPKELGAIKIISSDSGMPYSICVTPARNRGAQCYDGFVTSEEITTVNFPLESGVNHTAQVSLDSPQTSFLYAVNNSQDGRTENNWPGSNGNITSVASNFSTDPDFDEVVFFIDRQRMEMYVNLEAFAEGDEPESIPDGSSERTQNNTVSVPANQNSVLMWNSLYADTCRITVHTEQRVSELDIVQDYTSSTGQITVSPEEDTTYELTCRQLSDPILTRQANI